MMPLNYFWGLGSAPTVCLAASQFTERTPSFLGDDHILYGYLGILAIVKQRLTYRQTLGIDFICIVGGDTVTVKVVVVGVGLVFRLVVGSSAHGKMRS